EVLNRWMTASPGATTRQWTFYRDDGGDAARPIHLVGLLFDTGASTWKEWVFSLSGPEYTLAGAYYEVKDGIVLLTKGYTWERDAAGNTYLRVLTDYLNAGQSYARQTTTVTSTEIRPSLTRSTTPTR